MKCPKNKLDLRDPLQGFLLGSLQLALFTNTLLTPCKWLDLSVEGEKGSALHLLTQGAKVRKGTVQALLENLEKDGKK